MEVICSSETLVDFERATRRYIRKGRTLYVSYSLHFSSNLYNEKITALRGGDGSLIGRY
jgi:hypothetical protein